MTIDQLRDTISHYSKDVWITFDNALNKSPTLSIEITSAAAIAAAISANSPQLVKILQSLTTPEESAAAHSAAAVMGMTNIWYSYLELAQDDELKKQPAQIRMQALANHGGVAKKHFEIYTLAASIIGKCRGCITGHIAELKNLGITSAELRDIGKIAAAVNATSKLLLLETAK